MKKEQEINNIRGAITAQRANILNLSAKLEFNRKNLYSDMVTLFKYENDLNIGDTVKWQQSGFLDEILDTKRSIERIGKITSINYTDYTGIQVFVSTGVHEFVLAGHQVKKV